MNIPVSLSARSHIPKKAIQTSVIFPHTFPAAVAGFFSGSVVIRCVHHEAEIKEPLFFYE